MGRGSEGWEGGSEGAEGEDRIGKRAGVGYMSRGPLVPIVTPLAKQQDFNWILLEHAMKVVERIFEHRIRQQSEIDDMQFRSIFPTGRARSSKPAAAACE